MKASEDAVVMMDEIGDRRPIHRRLRDRLAAEIGQNRWLPGAPISSEPELARTYRINVGTVRKALDSLVQDGVLERVPGVGTFVRRPDFSHAFIRFTQVFGSASDPRVPESRILSRGVVTGPAEVTQALELPDRARVIRIQRLRIHEGAPVMHEEIWLDEARFAAMLNMKDEQPRLLYPVYESLCGEVVARALETITIGSATENDRKLIGLEPGKPVVCIARKALGYDSHVIEWRHSRSSAETFRYRVEIR